MRTPETRAQAGDDGSGQALSDERYRLLEPLVPAARSGGHPSTTDKRRLLDGFCHRVRIGCRWRHPPLPPAFLSWPTIYGHVRSFLCGGVWNRIRHHVVVMLREGAGREPSPTAAILDSPGVEPPEATAMTG